MRALGIKYNHTVLSETGISFDIKEYWHPVIDHWSPIYRDILAPFDFNKFTCPRLPVDMGKIDVNLFRACPNVLRIPIKWGQSLEVRLPQELYPVAEEIKRILQYDHYIMGREFEKFFVHLTIDNSIVQKNTTHRHSGFHGDGLQGGKFKKKLVCEHSYIMTDNYPTQLCLQPFFVRHLNEDRVNIFKEFDRQVKKENLFALRGGHLYLFDPYIVHTSPIIPETISRTFVRVTVTPAELLTDHNTINPMFSGQKYPERIEVREFVSDPDEEIPYQSYGINPTFRSH